MLLTLDGLDTAGYVTCSYNENRRRNGAEPYIITLHNGTFRSRYQSDRQRKTPRETRAYLYMSGNMWGFYTYEAMVAFIERHCLHIIAATRFAGEGI